MGFSEFKCLLLVGVSLAVIHGSALADCPTGQGPTYPGSSVCVPSVHQQMQQAQQQMQQAQQQVQQVVCPTGQTLSPGLGICLPSAQVQAMQQAQQQAQQLQQWGPQQQQTKQDIQALTQSLIQQRQQDALLASQRAEEDTIQFENKRLLEVQTAAFQVQQYLTKLKNHQLTPQQQYEQLGKLQMPPKDLLQQLQGITQSVQKDLNQLLQELPSQRFEQKQMQKYQSKIQQVQQLSNTLLQQIQQLLPLS